MIPDDPLDQASDSISDGQSVDWELTESKTLGDERARARVRALKGLERIAAYNRNLQGADRTGPSVSTAPPPPWGQLTPLELASAGRSGEVWRAWDAWLQREVALKFLFAPEGGSLEDSALLAEARALARVRHPGVVAVHGISSHDDRVGMWMEFLTGTTLEAEIQRRGPLPPVDVARVGLDACRALEAVVAAGLVHRDIKPANVVLEPGGRTVLADFGLGRRLAFADREPWNSSGTPLFMAPELLAGEQATPRSDIYALGVTLRWALTGRSPFRARNLEELRQEAGVGPSATLRSERPHAPAALVRAIDRAMSPRAEARYASAAALAGDLEKVVGDPRRRAMRLAGAASAILLIGAVALLAPRFGGRSDTVHSAQFSVSAPPGTTLNLNSQASAISPDGRSLAIVAADARGIRHIWIRPLDSLTPRRLDGTEGAELPFWSPDGRMIGFFADLKLKKISAIGGPAEILCSAPDPRGASWGKGGVIVFVPRATGSLYRVSAEGGVPVEAVPVDSARGETALRWPQFLPDGEHFLFVSLPPRDGLFNVYAATPSRPERRHVMAAGCGPVSAGSLGLVLASNGRLMLQGFDAKRMKPVGAPIALGRAPFSDVSVGQPLASASQNGVLTHLSESLADTDLMWVNRKGDPVGRLSIPAGRYEKVYFAPNGRLLLAERRDSPTSVDLWMIDVIEGKSTRFTQGSQSRMGGAPVWSSDGRRIVFSSNRGGRTQIYERSVDDAGEERLLHESSGQFKEVWSWSPDGRYIVYIEADPKTGWDLWLLPTQGSRVPTPYLRSPFGDVGGRVSPDGRWLAYASDATGKVEVYVRSFPAPGPEIPVCPANGEPVWSEDGREILVPRTEDGTVWSVPVTTSPTFKAGSPRILFRRRPESLYLAASPKGDRFLEVTTADNRELPKIVVDLGLRKSSGR
ncbi:MAG TPA: protein kinase [Candidatus Eisenbacteria bacterium]|nr:protein kinase [Candidatus Eisenbacteria bacterium]